MKTNPFITLSTDPSSYGSQFNPDEVRPLNTLIRSAAERAGVRVVVDDSGDEGDDEIDWFSQWCAEAHAWGQSRWVTWFKEQL